MEFPWWKDNLSGSGLPAERRRGRLPGATVQVSGATTGAEGKGLPASVRLRPRRSPRWAKSGTLRFRQVLISPSMTLQTSRSSVLMVPCGVPLRVRPSREAAAAFPADGIAEVTAGAIWNSAEAFVTVSDLNPARLGCAWIRTGWCAFLPCALMQVNRGMDDE